MEETTTNDVFDAFEKAQEAFYERRIRETRSIRELFVEYYYKKKMGDNKTNED